MPWRGRAVPSVAARGTALLTDLVDVAEHSPPSGDAHRRRRLVVLDAVERLASLAEEGPALLALEDLHWCDQLSLEIVAHLARRLPSLPLCVVGTLRTDELHQDAPARSWRARMLLQRLAVELRLSPLDREQSQQMVHGLLRGRRTSRRLVELVHQRSGGVPLHVEELVNAAAQGHLSPSSHYVPETLAEAVQQRFEALTEPARDSAVAAAVVRRTFDLDLLAAVAGTTVEHAAASLDELVDRHFVQEESPGWFGFRHALVRDAVAANSPLATRRTLHARVADVARRRPELGGDAYRSAHHEAAGQHDEAAEAAAAAALRASTLSAHQEALDLLHRAVRCLRADDDRRSDLLARRAVEAAATDDNAQASADFEAARDLLLVAGDAVPAAALIPGLVAARHLLGDPLPARIALLDRGLGEVEGLDGEAQRVRANLLAGKAAAYLVADRLDAAVEVAEDALAAAGAQDERTRLNTLVTVGTVEVFAGRHDDGWPRLEDATRGARELGLEAEAARGYRMIGSSASTLVEYDRAERWLRDGVEYAARTEQWNHRHYMASHQAHVWWCLGRWDESERAAQRLLTDAEGGITTRIIALHALGFVALGRGRIDAATELLGEARASGEEMRELQRFSPALWGLAECALLTGDSAAAVTLTEAGYDASHEVLEAANLFPFLVTGTRARLAQHDPSGARDWADRVSADLLTRGVPGMLPAVDHAEGLIQLAAGRTGKARDLLGDAHSGWSDRRPVVGVPVVRARPRPVCGRLEPSHRGRRTRGGRAGGGVRGGGRAPGGGGGRDRLPPRPARRAGAVVPTDPARVRGRAPRRAGAHQPGDRRGAADHGAHRGVTPRTHPRQARREPPLGDCRVGHRDRRGPDSLRSRPSSVRAPAGVIGSRWASRPTSTARSTSWALDSTGTPRLIVSTSSMPTRRWPPLDSEASITGSVERPMPVADQEVVAAGRAATAATRASAVPFMPPGTPMTRSTCTLPPYGSP